MTNTTNQQQIGPDTAITYLFEDLHLLVAKCGWQPAHLRRAAEAAIRERHHRNAEVVEDSHASGRGPAVYRLDLGSVGVFYTVESKGVVVRGYGYEVCGETLDDFHGGGFYLCDCESDVSIDAPTSDKAKRQL